MPYASTARRDSPPLGGNDGFAAPLIGPGGITPVPEPATIGLLVFGGLLLTRRR